MSVFQRWRPGGSPSARWPRATGRPRPATTRADTGRRNARRAARSVALLVLTAAAVLVPLATPAPATTGVTYGAQQTLLYPQPTPAGLAMDATGDLFVADDTGNQVLELAKSATNAVQLPFTGLKQPGGVAVDAAGDVYVADTGNNRILELRFGSAVPQVLPFTGLLGPEGVAVDSLGDVYVTDSGNDRVEELSSSSVQTTLGFSGLSSPWGIAVDAQRDVYVTDHSANSVLELPVTGPQATLAFSGLDQPEGVAVDSNGNVFVTDSGKERVLELAHGANLQSVETFTGLKAPDGVAVLAASGSDEVVVADHGNDQVLELPPGSSTEQALPLVGLGSPGDVAFDSTEDLFATGGGTTGEALEVDAGWTDPIQPGRPIVPSVLSDFGALDDPTGIAVDSSGDVALVDSGNQTVLELKAGAASPTVLPFSGLGASAQGIAFDPTGDVFVTDTSDGRVLELKSGAGSPTVLPFSGLVSPTGIAVDKNGDVFVVDSGADDVLELASGANFATVLAFSGLDDPHGVALDSLGDVFVADTGNNRIVELPANNAPELVPPLAGLVSPDGVAVGPNTGSIAVSEPGGVVELPAGAGLEPGAPTFFAAQPWNGAVSLYWSQASGTVTTYRIYQSTTAGHEVLVASVASSGQQYPTYPTYTVTGLTNGVPYYFDVRAVNGQAVNGGLVGPASSEAWAAPSSAYPPGYGSSVARLGPSAQPSLSTDLTGVAVDRTGDRFVADAGTPPFFPAKVVEIPAGSLSLNTPAVTLPFGSLGEPGGVAVDGAGDVYVTDTANNCVWEYEPAVNRVSKLPTTLLNDPQGIAVDSRGDVYVANTGADDVLELPNGLGSWDEVAFTNLQAPAGVAVDSSFDVFVTDQSNGGEVLELPEPAHSTQQSLPFGSLDDPSGLTVDASGHVYVADMDNHRVLELANGAAAPSTLPFHLNYLADPTDVAVDSSGNVYAVGLDGNGLAELPAGASAPLSPFLGLYKPGGVALDSSGNLYVANTSDNQIVELRNGTTTPSVLTSFVGLAEPAGVAAANGNVVSTQTGPAPDLEVVSGSQVATPLPGLSAGSSAAAFDASGDLFATVGDQVLELARGANTAIVVLTVPGATLNGVAVDSLRDIFVTDSSGVLELPEGSVTLVVLPFTGLQDPDGVAVDALGDVYVADGNQVWELYPDDTSAPQVPVPIESSAPVGPVGVAVDARGDVYAVGGNGLYELPVATPAPPPTTSAPPPPDTTTSTTTSTTTTTITTVPHTVPNLPRSALLTIDAGTVDVSKGIVPVPVSCWQSTCSGSLQLRGRVLVRVRKGHKRVRRSENVVIAKAEFSISGNRSATVKLHLTAAGRSLLAHARTHPRRLVLQLDDNGVVTTSSLLVT